MKLPHREQKAEVWLEKRKFYKEKRKSCEVVKKLLTDLSDGISE